MRRALLSLAMLVAVNASSGAAKTDELDAWCAQVKKASSVVICSDAELRQQAAARQHFFDKLRQTVSPETYKTLMAEQTRWVRLYTANCGVPIDGTVPALPIPQSVIECYRQSSRARNAWLVSEYGPQSSQPTVSSAPAPPIPTAPAAPRKAEWEAAMNAWYECLNNAVDTLAGQPEPARTVAEAAFGSCTDREAAFKDALRTDWDSIAKLKAETVRSQMVARVMAIRAAVSKLREKPDPGEKPARPAIDYNRM